MNEKIMIDMIEKCASTHKNFFDLMKYFEGSVDEAKAFL